MAEVQVNVANANHNHFECAVKCRRRDSSALIKRRMSRCLGGPSAAIIGGSTRAKELARRTSRPSCRPRYAVGLGELSTQMASRDVLTIDGSHGEGGGQVVRTALSLSAVTGRPFVLNKVRAKRRKPGLKRQHLTAVRAAAKICNADIVGDTLNSDRLEFYPKPIVAGDYFFQIGTAGSTTLVAQTVLPALFMADGQSEIRVQGGTHNPLAPPFDFLQRVYFPCLRAVGVELNSELMRYGFFPAGGGEFKVGIQPVQALGGSRYSTQAN